MLIVRSKAKIGYKHEADKYKSRGYKGGEE